MQTKGGGKHDILPVGRAPAVTLDCLWIDAPRSRCGHVPAIPATVVSTKDCMAHQSCCFSSGALVRTIHPRRRVRVVVHRALSQLRISSSHGGVHCAQVQQAPN
jgi:hypothetical protein